MACRRFWVALSLAAATTTAAACRGENLFTGGAVGTTGPTGSGAVVQITVPTDGATTSVGDSLTVTSSFSAPAGLLGVSFAALFVTDDSVAFDARAISFLNAPTDTTITTKLGPHGTRQGDVRVFAVGTDVDGVNTADSVTVKIVP